MKKYTCVIVEDEPMARKLLEQYVTKAPALELLSSISNPLAALDYLQKNEPDILFLDVQMPEITGISLLKILNKKPLVVLTTAYSEYAIEGFELDVADYLLKPITLERFLMSVDKLVARLEGDKSVAPAPPPPDETATPTYLFIKDGTKSIRVNFGDIQYIEGLKDYVRIHTPQRKVTTLQSLRHMADVLPSEDFIRVHHSYIVGINWVEEVQRDEVVVAGTSVPVSDTYRPDFRQFIEERHLK